MRLRTLLMSSCVLGLVLTPLGCGDDTSADGGTGTETDGSTSEASADASADASAENGSAEVGSAGDGDGDASASGDGDATAGDGDGDGTGDGDGDGDGDGSTGDGDGDSTTGDGDGDSTTGDGDGDSTTGDGDGDSTTGDGDGDSTTGDGDGDSTTGDGDGDGDSLLTSPNLWYTFGDQLVYVELDPSDGSVVSIEASTITTPLAGTFRGSVTMLNDGSLILARWNQTDSHTELYYTAQPPLSGEDVSLDVLGIVPDNLWIEALYTDCDGRVYLMDTGVDFATAEGNRLLRLSGDYLGGELTYEVITDLSSSDVADIDDMSPGIDGNGEITDGQGYAADSGQIYAFDYNTGTGTTLGTNGDTLSVFALGGPLFDDGTARLYVMDWDANIREADPVTVALSSVLVTGPSDGSGSAIGLTGPLTECESTLPEPE